MKKAVIFCSGEISGDIINEIDSETMLICADGGFCHAERLGLKPHIIIGDCDSTDTPYPQDIPHIVYPSEKDKTDSALCLDYAIEQGCLDILILGGLGGRLDHEFANYSLMLYGLTKGVKVRLIDGKNEIWMANSPFYMERSDKKYVSFFPFGGSVEGLTIKGLKYTADNITLDCGSVLTCGNEFAEGSRAYISFTSGNLLVMRCSDKKTQTL